MIAFFGRLLGLESRELYTQVLQLKQLLNDERRRVRYLSMELEHHIKKVEELRGQQDKQDGPQVIPPHCGTCGEQCEPAQIKQVGGMVSTWRWNCRCHLGEEAD